MADGDGALARPENDDERFGANVRRLREARGLSQHELARRLADVGLEGFHQTTVSRIEKGERPARLGEAKAIAQLLDSTIENMLTQGESAAEATRGLILRTNDLTAMTAQFRRTAWKLADLRAQLRGFLDDVADGLVGPKAVGAARDALARASQPALVALVETLQQPDGATAEVSDEKA